MRIKENYLDLNYYNTLVLWFYSLYVQKRERERKTVFYDFINDLSEIIESLQQSQKNFFISQLQNQINEGFFYPFLENDESFDEFTNPYLSNYKKFIFSLTPSEPQQIKNQKFKDTDILPETFEELFYNSYLVKPCIDILKDLNPPLIDLDYNFIGKSKGAICVWIDELQRQGIVKSNYPKERKLFADLIPKIIKRFSIDESMFGKYHHKAEEQYRNDIKTLISQTKLSQNSHLGK